MTAYPIKLADMPDEVEFSDDWLDKIIRYSVGRIAYEKDDLRLLRRIEELIAENKLLREALKQEQEKFQLETLRTSECSVLLRRWIEQPRPGRFRFHQATDIEDKIYEWRKLVGDSVKLLATPINLGRTQEPKP